MNCAETAERRASFWTGGYVYPLPRYGPINSLIDLAFTN